ALNPALKAGFIGAKVAVDPAGSLKASLTIDFVARNEFDFVGGHRYRTRSVEHVIEEIAWAKKAFPEVKEFFFDDDTFTDNLPRAEAIAKELNKLGVTWSCNAKANVPYATLKALRDNGLRLLLVGYESGNQQILHNIKKGMRVDVARKFTKDCHA